MGSIRQKIGLTISVRVPNVDLSKYKDITFYIKQADIEKSFSGSSITVDSSDTSVMYVSLDKTSMDAFYPAPAKWQVVITHKTTGERRTHNPVHFRMGELLWENGYGS